MRRTSWRLLFFVLNGIGLLILLARTGTFSSQKLMVLHTFPDAGEVCLPQDVSEVTVEFGGLLDPRTIKADALRLLPFVPGTVRLEGERFLRLQLSKKLAKATRYEVDVSPQVRGRGGERPQFARFFFLTPSLAVKEVSQAKIEPDRSSILAVEFNSAVNPQALMNALELSDPLGHSIAFTPVGGRPDAQVRVRIPKTEWEELRLTIKQGLTGTEGPLPLAGDYRATVKVAASLQFLGMKADEKTDDEGAPFNAISIRMNSPVDATTAGQFITVEPAVKHTFEAADDGLAIWGEFQPAQRYTVTLKTGLSAGAAGALVQDITRSVWFPDLAPNIRFAYGDGVLSTQGLRTVAVRSVNVKACHLTVHRLYANNLVEYAIREGSMWFDNLGTMVNQTDVQPAYRKNQEVETLVRLDALVRGDTVGAFCLQLDGSGQRWNHDAAVMVVSDLGIWVHQAQDQIVVWVTSLASGRPQSNCGVTLYSDRRQNLGMAMTDADGVARIAVPPLPETEKAALVIASHGHDLNYLPISKDARDRGPEAAEGRAYLKRGYEVFAFAERGIYRPGDTVHVCGYVRDAELLRPPPMPLNLIVKGPTGREVLRKTVLSDAGGRLLADIPIVYNSPSGHYQASWHLPSKEDTLGSAEFQVADYIPQTLRITIQAPDGQPATSDLPIHVHGEQLFGGPAVGLRVKCMYRYRADDVQPKGWDAFKFGDDRKKHEIGGLTVLDPATLDAQGNTTFTLKAPQVQTPAAIRAEVQVEVLEPGGRVVTEYLTRTMDPQPCYLGVKLPPTGIQSGQPQEVQLAAVLLNGSADTAAEGFTATLYRVTYSNVLRKQCSRLVYDWTRHESAEMTQKGRFCRGRAGLTLEPKLPGSYRLVVESDSGGAVTTDFEAAGLGAAWVSDDPERVNLTMDKPAYRPGDTARVHLRAPFAGTALLTLETNQVLEHRLIHLTNGEGREAFNVREEWRPNVYVAATVVRPVQPEKNWRPHRAAGVVRLKVDCTDRRLDLKVELPEQVRPGHKLDVAVRVFSAGQAQAGTAVTLIAVDEGVLALTKFLTPSPWEFFYPLRRLDVQEFDIYGRLAPELEEWRVGRKLQPGGGGGDDDEELGDLGRRLSPIQAHRVKTAVLFAGNLIADGQGVARTSFAVPEYIGELRIMATAAQDNRFGSVQRALKVKSPIMAQASWPRFLAPDDRFGVPVTLFNRTDKEQAIQLNVRVQGPLQIADPLPMTVTVPAGSDKLVRLAMKATGVGVIAPRITARAGDEQYTESVEIPVRPAVGLARTSGVIALEAGKPQAISLTEQFLTGTTKTSVVIAGSRMVEFTDALQSLLTYPYGCVEQTTSKLVPLIYLADLTRLADPQAVGKEEIDGLLAAGFLQLQMMQTYSGGLGAWPGQTEPYPWGSLYAADLLVEAEKAGYEVPKKLLSPLQEYLTEHIREWATARQDYQPTHMGEAAYACYILARAGQAPYAWMSTLEETIRNCDTKKLAVPTTARFHLAAAYLTAGQAPAGRELIAGTFPATIKRQIDGCLDSPLREAAVKLLVLLDIDPDSPQVPALTETVRRGLRCGAQLTTQEAAFALMAAGKYARRTGTPGEGTVGITLPDGSRKTFTAAEGWHYEGLTPGQTLAADFQGKGRVHAFWTVEGVPAAGPVKEEDSGLAVRRTFFRIDGKTPVAGNGFRAGELYQVVLEVKASGALDNLVMTDLLPAGLEIADLDRAGTGKFLRDAKASFLTVRHVEPRDDRLIIFAGTDQGVCEYRYVVRAVTAGEFVLPATEVSCMYDPGLYSVHGRGTIKVTPQ